MLNGQAMAAGRGRARASVRERHGALFERAPGGAPLFFALRAAVLPHARETKPPLRLFASRAARGARAGGFSARRCHAARARAQRCGARARKAFYALAPRQCPPLGNARMRARMKRHARARMMRSYAHMAEKKKW